MHFISCVIINNVLREYTFSVRYFFNKDFVAILWCLFNPGFKDIIPGCLQDNVQG